MKKLLLILFAFMSTTQQSNAQNRFNNYITDWEKVYAHELELLPKSALTEVNEIYERAKKENNSPQVIKSLIYKSKFALMLEEDAQLKVINDFKNEIATSKLPTSNILESMLADIYWQYFQQNRWRFYNRTKTQEKVDSNDFRTWDLQTIFEESHKHYQKSLNSSLELQQIDLTQYDDILTRHLNSKEYRPTLYDFLAHRAIDFYKIEEQNITRPSYKFEIDDANYLKNNRDYIKNSIESKDSLSQHLHALKLYKNLTLFHLKDKNPKALVKLTLDRLSFIKSNTVINDKDEVYESTLQELKQEYKDNELSTEIAFVIASFYKTQANLYNAKSNETNRFKRKEALEICEEAIKEFPKSLGAKKCAALKNQILSKSIAINAEKYIPINTPSRLLINYKNTDNLYFTSYETSKKEQKELTKIHNDSARIAFINKLTINQKWESSLRNEHDYQKHTTEVLFPQHKNGNYLIIATTENELAEEKTIAQTFLQVTDLALIENTNDGIYQYQVVDRNTGKPIVGAKINLKNYNTNKYNKSINKNFVSDEKGQFSFKSRTQYRNVVATVKHKDDTATFGDYYMYKYSKDEVQKDETIYIKPFIFTDRSIYRPGQTVHFKAIVLKKQDEKSEVITDETVRITLYNVNNEIVKILDLKLNEFGSVSGEFILPNNGLTGNYSITVTQDQINRKEGNRFNHSRHNFSVEEYKRPKFETEFKPVTATYKLNDSITAHGTANAFAGSSISDAKVTYKVVRTAQFPRWYGWSYRRPSISSEEQEIAHGETMTDASGNYEIVFKAIPDLKVSADSQPTFSYKVFADVTDINGETRSAETIIKVGYHALTVNIQIEDKINKNNKENSLSISTKNLNGEFVPTKGTLKIYKLQAPKKPQRKRPWNAPDYAGFSEIQFRQIFPNDPFNDDESDSNKWANGKLVYDKSFDTDKTKKYDFKSKKWASGKYKVILECKDKFGQLVKDEQQFDIYSNKESKIADSKLFFINSDKTSYKPNENVELKIGSASKDLTATITVEKKNEIISTHLVHLNNETKTIKIPVSKDDLGGFSIKYYYVNYNSFENGNINIVVPYESNDLSIETLTFRDKLQPGSEQTWSFKIKGNKNEKVASELLASMYDASLDEFKSHNWSFNPIERRNYYSYGNSTANHSFGNQRFNVRNQHRNYNNLTQQQFDALNWFGFSLSKHYGIGYLAGSSNQFENIEIENDSTINVRNVVVTDSKKDIPMYSMMVKKGKMIPNKKIVGGKSQLYIAEVPSEKLDFKGMKIRKNFQETAFFFPHLRTDKEGNVSFDFTVPEALTRWKMQLLAHSKDLKTATKTLTTVTQKDLMVLPNPPRFLREGDEIIFSSKISNLTDKNLNGFAQLQLVDAITGKEINDLLDNTEKNKNFTLDAKGNTNVSWSLKIPMNKVQAIQYKIVAKAGDFSDGEQNALPVLSNRMLVTETLPMWIKSNETKTFTLDKLKNNTSTTLSNHKLTLEVTSNPAWYVVQALPYLMEYPYECSEQTFSRYYANALASHIANANPRIQEVFNQWKSSDALLSNLEKNQELKSLIIQETPWLRDAQSETEQKKRIALLFDLNKMKNESESAINKLKKMQFSNGGFPWFKGSKYPNRYITQHIATGFGHLNKLNVILNESEESMIHKSVTFLDEDIVDDYKKLLERAKEIREKAKTKSKGLKNEKDFLAKQHISYFQLQYLYMRSFYSDVKMSDDTKSAIDYYRNQSETYWKNFNLYSKGIIALVQYRNDNKKLASKILKSLRENSTTNEELGMYWKSNSPSWYWYQAPIETHSLLIEAFAEIENDTETIDNLKVWLLKNKQTNRWETTKATTEAVYALLLQGSDWLEVTDFMDVKIGDKTIDPLALDDSKVEAGTGYFKTSYNSIEITPEMATVTLNKDSDGIAWGALYWQYFEDLDKITSAETPLKLSKKLFLKQNTDKGEELTKIKDSTSLKLGDLVRVRIELKVDREMEFVHMKDMRASGFEPINVLSKYKYQDGLGYYESTKDASTNFFFDRLPKGVYVFEYDLRVNNAGDFSNGITTIQSMYAPEFSSHSEGVRVQIK